MKPLIVLTAFPQGWIGRERPLAGRHGACENRTAATPTNSFPSAMLFHRRTPMVGIPLTAAKRAFSFRSPLDKLQSRR